MTRVCLFSSLAALALLFAACSGPPSKVDQPDLPEDGTVRLDPPSKSVFIRAAFDDDPATYLGRFFPDKLTNGQIDENEAAKTRCSQYIKHKVVNAGGTTFEESFHTSQSVNASLGIKLVGGAEAGSDSGGGVRVRYKLDKRMRAEVDDVDGFVKCCEMAPDQCSERYIGEFYFGSGEVLQFAGSEQKVKAEGAYKMVAGDFEFKQGVAWKRVTTFNNVYFAFRTQRSEIGERKLADDTDCSWANNVPKSLDGLYFVGMSQPMNSRAQSRDYALQNGTTQVVKYMGEYLTTQMGSTASAMEGYLKDEQVISSVAKGLAKRVKAEKWCKADPVKTPDGMLYETQVLVFFPNSEAKAAAQDAIGAVEQSLEAQGKLTPKDKTALKKMRGKL